MAQYKIHKLNMSRQICNKTSYTIIFMKFQILSDHMSRIILPV